MDCTPGLSLLDENTWGRQLVWASALRHYPHCEGVSAAVPRFLMTLMSEYYRQRRLARTGKGRECVWIPHQELWLLQWNKNV